MLRERSGGGGVVFERFLLRERERERELKRATDDE